jgi:uncharacterized protein
MQIRDRDRVALLEIFASISAPIEVWAYGSRVNGGAHEGSDLDLVLRTTDLSPLSQNEFCELVERIRESNIPILVDLHDWARLPTNFQLQIMKKYEVLFDNRAPLLENPTPAD